MWGRKAVNRRKGEGMKTERRRRRKRESSSSMKPLKYRLSSTVSKPGLCRDGPSEISASGTLTAVSVTGKTTHAQMTRRAEGTRERCSSSDWDLKSHSPGKAGRPPTVASSARNTYSPGIESHLRFLTKGVKRRGCQREGRGRVNA